MGKQVREAAKLGYRLNETDVRVLQYLAEPLDEGLGVSNEGLGRELNVCKGTIRASIHRLNDCGLLRTTAQFLRNGGQIENKHEVTVQGVMLLLALQDALDEAVFVS